MRVCNPIKSRVSAMLSISEGSWELTFEVQRMNSLN